MLKPYELNDADWAEYLREKNSRVRTYVGVPQFVRVLGVGGESLINLEKFLGPLAGKPMDTEKMDQMLTRLAGVGRYDSLTYTMIQEDGQDGLLIRVQEKSYAPPSLRPGFLIDGTQNDNVTFTMESRLTFMDVAGYRSEWRTDLRVGETYGIHSELYRPFAPFARWFFAPIADASASEVRRQ